MQKSALREILGVPVLILRKPQKNMYLTVRPDGSLRVTCPPSLPDAEIDRFVAEKSVWLRKRREDALKRAARSPADYAEGCGVPLWGRSLTLRLCAERPCGVSAENGALVVRAPENSTPQERAALIKRFRRAQLAAAVPPLLARWQPEIGAAASGWHAREMSSRWGSCNTRTGRLCFNLRLTEKSPQCLEYIVVHELCHLIVPNHSAAFWNRVARCLPDWRRRRELTNSAGEDA